MMEKFEALSLREQVMVGVMIVLIGLFVIWQFIFVPINRHHNTAEQALERAQKERVYVEQNISRLGVNAQAAGDLPFSRTVLVSLSREAGIERLSRIQPQPNGDLKVWIDNVSSLDLYGFLQSADRRYATRITNAQIKRQDGDAVSAQINFSMPQDN